MPEENGNITCVCANMCQIQCEIIMQNVQVMLLSSYKTHNPSDLKLSIPLDLCFFDRVIMFRYAQTSAEIYSTG